MGGAASRDKGRRGEREVIVLLQPVVRQVYEAAGQKVPELQRNLMQAHKGGSDVHGLEWMSLEVKWHKDLAVPSWWRQTLRQCGQHQTPVLFYRRNCEEWKVMMEVTLLVNGGVIRTEAVIALQAFLRYFRARLTQELSTHG